MFVILYLFHLLIPLYRFFKMINASPHTPPTQYFTFLTTNLHNKK